MFRYFVLCSMLRLAVSALAQGASSPVQIDSVDRDINVYAQAGYAASTNWTIESFELGDFQPSLQHDATTAEAYGKAIAAQQSSVLLTNGALVVQGTGTTHAESSTVTTRGVGSCDSGLEVDFTLAVPCVYSLAVNIQSDATADLRNESDAGLSGPNLNLTFGGTALSDNRTVTGLLLPGAYTLQITSLLTSQTDPPPQPTKPLAQRNSNWEIHFTAQPAPDDSNISLTWNWSLQPRALLLQWPLSQFELQSTTNLAAPLGWTTITNFTIVGDQVTYLGGLDGATRFFRLRKAP